MTVPTVDVIRPYVGNGVSVEFAGPKVFDSSHLNVYLTIGGVSVLLQEGVDYEVTNVGASESTVTMYVAPAAGTDLNVVRSVPFTQDIRVKNQGAFFPEIHEEAFDSAVMMIQQLGLAAERSLRLPEPNGAVSTELPTPVAGGVPMVNDAGTGFSWALWGTNPEALASLAMGAGSSLVGYQQSAAQSPVSTTAAAIASKLDRTGNTGIFTTAGYITGHRAGPLAYRKLVGGKAQLLTDLSRFYPEGAFISQPDVPVFAQYAAATWTETGTADIWRYDSGTWAGPQRPTSNDIYRARVIDLATGREFSTNYPTDDYSAKVVWNGTSTIVQVFVKMPVDVDPPTTMAFLLAHYPNGQDVVFLDPVNGDDRYDGSTFEWAVKTFTAALALSPKVIFIKPGVYDLGNYPGLYTTAADLSIRCVGGRATFIPRPFTFSAWALDSGTTYVSTVGGSPTPTGVVDLGTLDEFGMPTVLTNAGSLALCKTTAGSFYYDAAGPRKMYVNLADGGVPTSANVMPFGLANTFRHSAPGAKVHVADCDFISGSAGAASARDGDADSVAIVERCRFIGSYNGDGWQVKDIGLSIAVDCIAAYNFNDGFNYHELNSLSPHFIEVDCVGIRNNATGTGNGFTSHESCVGFRINCDAALNAGPGFADVTDAQTYNVNCTSRANGPSTSAHGFYSGDDAVVVVDGGSADGNGGSDFIAAVSTATLKVRDAYGLTSSGTIAAL